MEHAQSSQLGTDRNFSNANELEKAAGAACASQTLLLCGTARLARRLLHRWRQQQQQAATPAWLTPAIHSLKGWVYQSYAELWPAARPLTPELSLQLWHMAAQQAVPPAGLNLEPSLYRQMQFSLEALLNEKLDPLASQSEQPLARFRQRATQHFLNLLPQYQAALWSDILKEVCAAIESQGLQLPKQTIYIPCAQLTGLEKDLLAAIAKKSRLTLWKISQAANAEMAARVYATPEQECRSILAEILQAWNKGFKNLGLVCAERAYLPRLKKYLAELAGAERPDFQHAIRYNLALGLPLVEHPLFQTAIIPLKLWNEPDPLPLLANLLTSPYLPAPKLQVLQQWRQAANDLRQPRFPWGLFQELMAQSPLAPMQRLVEQSPAPLAEWLQALQKCLKDFGFYHFAGQYRTADNLAQKHLESCCAALIREAGGVRVNAAQALSWLSALAEEAIVSEKTSELTGIQVLTVPEAQGLAFEQLWVVGLHGGALPLPPAEWPLLDPQQQRLVAGGSFERQWSEAQGQLNYLAAAADQVHCSRAFSDDEETPYLPCPLLPSQVIAADRLIFDPWKNLSAEWARARWLSQGQKALQGTHQPRAPEGQLSQGLSGEWSVSAIQDLTACPFRFFCSHILKLEPWPELTSGLDSRQRGIIIHNILKTFVAELPTQVPNWPADQGSAQRWLERAIEQELKRLPANIFREAEHQRLKDLLNKWLELEAARAQAGWQFHATEISFQGLSVSPISLCGRLDRIDQHASEGLIIWDYKTGTLPNDKTVTEKVTEPQLPLYLLALQARLLPDLQKTDQPIQAGYIALKTTADVAKSMEANRQPIKWDQILPDWTKRLQEKLAAPSQGYYAADPDPRPRGAYRAHKSACTYCPFDHLCGYFDETSVAADADDQETNDER